MATATAPIAPFEGRRILRIETFGTCYGAKGKTTGPRGSLTAEYSYDEILAFIETSRKRHLYDFEAASSLTIIYENSKEHVSLC